MTIYADSSFLVALYLEADVNWSRANAQMARTASPIAFTPLQRLELRNAIRLCAWRGHIDEPAAQAAIQQADEDLRDGFLFHTAASFVDVCRKADELSAHHPGCRTLDLIHTATALVTKAEVFLSFDDRQKKLARAAGLKVLPKDRSTRKSR
ncbi:MAG: type II toxin-antitoxin system VapC family toxin [Verrucomicrobiales bacterium]